MEALSLSQNFPPPNFPLKCPAICTLDGADWCLRTSLLPICFDRNWKNFQPPYLAGGGGGSGSFYFQSERRNRTTTTAAKETKKKKSNNKKRRKSDCWVIGNSVVLYQIKRSERNRETTTVGSDGIEIHGWIRFQGPSFDWRRSPIACLFFLCSCNPSKDKGERRIIIPHRWSDSTEREHSEWWTAL